MSASRNVCFHDWAVNAAAACVRHVLGLAVGGDDWDMSHAIPQIDPDVLRHRLAYLELSRHHPVAESRLPGRWEATDLAKDLEAYDRWGEL